MTLHVIAHTTHDGPVVLRSCETVQEQRRHYRRALRLFGSGGFSPDVVGVSMDGDSEAIARAPPPADSATRQRLAGTGPATRMQLAIDFASGDTHS